MGQAVPRRCRANTQAVAAVQAVGRINAAGNGVADTARWTNAAASLTANTFWGINTVTVLPNSSAAKRKILAVGRKLPQVKILSFALVNLKDLQRITLFSVG